MKETYCDNIEAFDNAEKLVKRACMLIEQSLTILASDIDNNPDTSIINNKLSFLKDQLILIFLKQRRYSADTLIWFCAIYFSFPGAYKKFVKATY